MNRAAVITVAAVAAAWLAGCDDTVPPEELDNDRIIAVRATPPHIPAGGESTLDAFVTMMGSGPAVVSPLIVQLPPETPATPAAPAGLRNAVVNDGGTWKVVAPDEATLAAARTELGLMPTDPIPLEVLVGISFAASEDPLFALKTVYLGNSVENPALGPVMVNGGPAADGMMVPIATDIPLHVDATETDEVFWLSSVGGLSDLDDPDATLNHDPEDDPPSLLTGHLAVVKRDELGGVCWGFWTISVTQ